jgi:hypothetical protein
LRQVFSSCVVAVYRTRGQARSYLGDYPGAVDDFGRAIQLNPTDAANQEARGWACLACGANQLALPDFEEAPWFRTPRLLANRRLGTRGSSNSRDFLTPQCLAGTVVAAVPLVGAGHGSKVGCFG